MRLEATVPFAVRLEAKLIRESACPVGGDGRLRPAPGGSHKRRGPGSRRQPLRIRMPSPRNFAPKDREDHQHNQ